MSNEEKLALEARKPALLAKIEAKNKEVAGKISHAYAEASRSLSNALGHTICAGLMMIERKEEVPHGEFGPWLEKYCPEIQWRSASNFMNAARSAVVSVLGKETLESEIGNRFQFEGAPLHDVLSADPVTLTKAARGVQDQFRDFLAGKTQHQLLLDWKEIKEKDKPRAPRTEATAEEKAEADTRMADEAFNQIVSDIQLFVLQGTALQCASDNVKKALLEMGIEMNNRLREAIAAPKPKKKGGKA